MTRIPTNGFDVAVVGGGIIGAGIARDAALRGLTVALFEKKDYGAGTTSGSTRLIHGGLRYLEMLDFALVRMDLRERETLLRIAPHLVKPLEFFLPFYEGAGSGPSPFELRMGMVLYDALSFDKSLPNHRRLSAAETLAEEPGLLASGLKGAVAYFDGQVNSPERLAMENIVDARAHGAVTLNYAEVTGAARGGVRVRDLLDGEEAEVRARVVVNASGPWFDRLAARLEPHPRPLIRTTKGVHLACPAVNRHALALISPVDGRLFFVIPWLGYSWIGTTDTDFREDPGEARATEADVDYLVRSAAGYFPQMREAEVYWTVAGVRALVMKGGKESSISRRHRIVSEPGLVSVLGGKITGFRAIAEDAVDAGTAAIGRARSLPDRGAAAARGAECDGGRRPFAGALRESRGGGAAPGGVRPTAAGRGSGRSIRISRRRWFSRCGRSSACGRRTLFSGGRCWGSAATRAGELWPPWSGGSRNRLRAGSPLVVYGVEGEQYSGFSRQSKCCWSRISKISLWRGVSSSQRICGVVRDLRRTGGAGLPALFRDRRAARGFDRAEAGEPPPVVARCEVAEVFDVAPLRTSALYRNTA